MAHFIELTTLKDTEKTLYKVLDDLFYLHLESAISDQEYNEMVKSLDKAINLNLQKQKDFYKKLG